MTLSLGGPYGRTTVIDVDGIPMAEAPLLGRGRFAVHAHTPHGVQVVLPATDITSGRDRLVQQALANPGAFLDDRGALRVELWMIPAGWNEGHEVCFDPMMCLYTNIEADLDDVRAAVNRAARSVSWTDFEVRLAPAGSGAPRLPTPLIASEMAGFVTHSSRHYIP